MIKTLYTSLIHPCLSIHPYFHAWHGTYQNNTSKLIFVLQKKAIRAINNLAYNEHTNESSNVPKYSNFLISISYKLQVLTYIFQLLLSNIDKELESSLLINNQIHRHSTIRTNNQMSILRVNRSKTKYCPSQWYDNMEFFTWMYLKSTYHFQCTLGLLSPLTSDGTRCYCVYLYWFKCFER